MFLILFSSSLTLAVLKLADFLTYNHLTFSVSVMENNLPPEKNSPVPLWEGFHCSSSFPDVQPRTQGRVYLSPLSSLVNRQAAKMPPPPDKIGKQQEAGLLLPPRTRIAFHRLPVHPKSQDKEACSKEAHLPKKPKERDCTSCNELHFIALILCHNLTVDVVSRDARPAPRKNRLPRPAKSRPCPAPQNWRNLRAAAGQNWLQIPLIPLFITPTHDALKEERVGKSFHLTLCTDWDYLLRRNTF